MSVPDPNAETWEERMAARAWARAAERERIRQEAAEAEAAANHECGNHCRCCHGEVLYGSHQHRPDAGCPEWPVVPSARTREQAEQKRQDYCAECSEVRAYESNDWRVWATCGIGRGGCVYGHEHHDGEVWSAPMA